MNIIFGSELTEQIQTRYTILELDTFNLLPSDQVKTAYCLIQFIPIEEMIEIQSLKDLHSNLMAEYRKRNKISHSRYHSSCWILHFSLLDAPHHHLEAQFSCSNWYCPHDY